MNKIKLEPNTTLYPVPVILVTCGQGENTNIFSLNRIASCNAEPPMLSISVRPGRASHDFLAGSGEFGVNIPWPEMELISDFVGTTTLRETDKWADTGLTPFPGEKIASPLIQECPVNLECRVYHTMRLPSHTLFVAEVLAIHADPQVLTKREEVNYLLARGGLPYRSAVVRERPVDNIKPDELRRKIRANRENRGIAK